MDEFLDNSHNVPDTPTPISSAGSPTQPYRNAAGEFNLKKELRRKVKSRKDLGRMTDEEPDLPDVSQPEYDEGPLNTGGTQKDNATDRWFGSFSIESKRAVWDLLSKHPKFGKKGPSQLNRVGNNTREVLLNDPTKIINNGGSVTYENQPQSSQEKY